MSKVLLADGADLSAITTPEVTGAAHAWAYLPDLAETVALLADREATLPGEARFHFGGHRLTGQAMARAVQRVTGGNLPIRKFNWLPIYLAAPFVTFCREVIEMRYLWPTSLQLDNTRLTNLLGAEPHTALDEAIRTSITALRSARSTRPPPAAATTMAPACERLTPTADDGESPYPSWHGVSGPSLPAPAAMGGREATGERGHDKLDRMSVSMALGVIPTPDRLVTRLPADMLAVRTAGSKA